MERVFADSERSYSDVRYAAVAICAMTPTQRHLGLLHKSQGSDVVELLHLGWHHRLKNEEPDDGYLWIDPYIPSPRLRQLAAFSRKVWRTNGPPFPYALSQTSDCFDPETGRYLLGTTNIGLTCATFVVAIFNAVGLSLVDVQSWPAQRPGDTEWRQYVIDMLRQFHAPEEHVTNVENQEDWVRYRPEDVAGAATADQLPAEFSLASERAQQILQLLSDPSSRLPRPQRNRWRLFLTRIIEAVLLRIRWRNR